MPVCESGGVNVLQTVPHRIPDTLGRPPGHLSGHVTCVRTPQTSNFLPVSVPLESHIGLIVKQSSDTALQPISVRNF